jgi:hypothetical protein
MKRSTHDSPPRVIRAGRHLDAFGGESCVTFHAGRLVIEDGVYHPDLRPCSRTSPAARRRRPGACRFRARRRQRGPRPERRPPARPLRRPASLGRVRPCLVATRPPPSLGRPAPAVRQPSDNRVHRHHRDLPESQPPGRLAPPTSPTSPRRLLPDRPKVGLYFLVAPSRFCARRPSVALAAPRVAPARSRPAAASGPPPVAPSPLLLDHQGGRAAGSKDRNGPHKTKAKIYICAS